MTTAKGTGTHDAPKGSKIVTAANKVQKVHRDQAIHEPEKLSDSQERMEGRIRPISAPLIDGQDSISNQICYDKSQRYLTCCATCSSRAESHQSRLIRRMNG